jgi:hypothetical protein
MSKIIMDEEIAQNYLDQYLKKEQPLCIQFQDALDIEAIHDALVQFQVIRTVPGTGKQRFSPIITFLEQADTLDHPIILVSKFHELLRKQYGKKMISAASKLMWLRQQGNIIIIDALAKKALRCPSDVEYAIYAAKWASAYKSFKPQIKAAADKIKNNENKHIVESEWFSKRVFDLWLWSLGKEGKTL